MPMEIEGARWTATRPWGRAPSAIGAVAPSPSADTVPGLKIVFLRTVESEWLAAGAGGSAAGGYSTKPPTKGGIDFFITPKLEALGFEMVGASKFNLDSSPVWAWRKTGDPLCKYQLYISSGTFAGVVDACTDTPTLETKVKVAPKAVYQWSAEIKPVDGQLSEGKRRAVLALVRETNAALMKVSGYSNTVLARTEKAFVVDPIVVPVDPIKPVPWPLIGGSAAIIGIALTMLTWGRKG